MSSEPTWAEVCHPEAALVLSPADFCRESTPAASSPIDDYYDYVARLMTLADPKRMEENEVLGQLLLLGLVSGVEHYFREIITGTLRICEFSRQAAADQTIHFGAVDHYGLDGLGAALFDATSLADGKEIKKRTEKLIGLSIPTDSSVHAASAEFDKVCVMRHAAVHSRGALGRGNVRDLGLESSERSTAELVLSYAAIQQAGKACQGVVRAYNRFLFRKVAERWAADETALVWDWHVDKSSFTSLTDLYKSDRDAAGPHNAYHRYLALKRTFAT